MGVRTGRRPAGCERPDPRRLPVRLHPPARCRPASPRAGFLPAAGARCHHRDGPGLAHHLLELRRRAAVRLERRRGTRQEILRPAVREPAGLPGRLREHAGERRLERRAVAPAARWRLHRIRYPLDPAGGRPGFRRAAEDPGDRHRHQRTQAQRGAHLPPRLLRCADRPAEPRQPARPPAPRPSSWPR